MRWPVAAGVAVAVIVVGVSIWLLVARGAGPFGGPDTPEFSFALRRVSGEGLEGKASRDALAPVARDVRATLDELYVGAFVDPDEWDGGEFPNLAEVFAGDAAGRAREDVADLTLGPDAGRISFVQPKSGRLDVRFLLGEDGNPFAAWAQTVFRATADVDDGGSLRIDHRGRYLLRPIEGRWLIVGYEVAGRLRPDRAAATP